MSGRLVALLLRILWRPVGVLCALTLGFIAVARLYTRFVNSRPGADTDVAVNLGTTCVVVAVALTMLARAAGRRLAGRDGRPASTSQGSAHWGSTRDRHAPRGLILGRDRDSKRALVRYDGDAHLVTLAPTGAGKGIGCVMPNLLSYPGSVLVTDPKGENYLVTEARRRALGHRVMALDPFALVGGDASFNPLDELDPAGPDAIDDAAGLAEMLVLREPRESGDTMFWSEEAKALLTGLILHVAASEPVGRRTLATVWEYLSLPPRALTQLWTAMGKSAAAGGAIARAAARVRQKGDRVRSGILAQAQSHAHFLESPRLARVMHHSSFSFADLKHQAASIYIVLPPDRIDACRRWLRLMVGCALQSVMRTRGAPRHRVVLMIDELATLGVMPPLERAVALARGYGATCWLLAQDLAQLKALYPVAWPTFIANAGVLQAFGTNDVDTASYVSDMLGPATVRVASSGRSRARGIGALGHGAQRRDSHGDVERARPLLSPDEVRRLDPTTSILLMPGADPLCVTRVDYRTDREFRGQFAANPMHAPLPGTAAPLRPVGS